MCYYYAQPITKHYDESNTTTAHDHQRNGQTGVKRIYQIKERERREKTKQGEEKEEEEEEKKKKKEREKTTPAVHESC